MGYLLVFLTLRLKLTKSFNLKSKKMKKVIFGLFVASMFVLASCGGPSDKDVKALDSSSLDSQSHQDSQDLNTTVDSDAATGDSTEAPE